MIRSLTWKSELLSSNLKYINIDVILATDCGSTTSKARFFKRINGEYRYVASGEAPTTVEAPYEDVTLGVLNAVREVEELTGYKILSENGQIITPSKDNVGVDLYVTTSSAGGGLQMVVSGVVKTMTVESAERAALGAGSIVMDALASDDGRPIYEKVNVIRFLRPDIILVAGGTDGGNVVDVSQAVELIRSADPKARFGADYELPIVYAGNKDLREHVKKVLGGKYALSIVDNIRPSLEDENVWPAKAVIHELFMEHVMSHAPGYNKLMKWTDVPIMPTPAGEGIMFQSIAESLNINVIGVGLGGATTNVYSNYDGNFVRTVSANLGMSYSVCNVLKEAGINNIMRWIPFEIEQKDLENRLRNKMIRPTTIPATLDELIIEHALAREALRLGFQHHKSLARPLRGVVRGGDLARWSRYDQDLHLESYIDMLKVGWLGGTGGLLSHAPRRVQSAIILIDGFQPEGVTKLGQDSVFMMPHLGVLSTVHTKAALEIFDKDCLVRLGTCIAPKGQLKEGEEAITVDIISNRKTITEKVLFGDIKIILLGKEEKATAEIRPSTKLDVGMGPGHPLNTTIEGGEVGIIIDARGRPLVLPEDIVEMRKHLIKWFTSLDAYPESFIEKQSG